MQSHHAPVAPPPRRPPVPLGFKVAIALSLLAAIVLKDYMVVRYIFALQLIALGFYRRSLSNWILIMMIVGGMLGSDFPSYGPKIGLPIDALQLPSQIFIRLVKTVVAPLLFSTLVIGIAGHADLKTVGRMGLKSILYFEFVTTIALVVGLVAINFSNAGAGIPQTMSEGSTEIHAVQHTVTEIILHTFPENFAKSVADGEVLQVVVFSLIFGMSMIFVSEERRKPLLAVIEGLAETMFKFTGIVMGLAPVAVGSAVAYTVAKMGFGVFGNLLNLLLTLYLSLIFFIVCILLPIILIARIPLVPFLRAASEPVSIAFATSTSEAALPTAMERLEKLGVHRHVVSFVMPMGYSFNLDGTTLYLAVASVFVAQAAGIELSLGSQLAMMASLMLSSKGVAGVPRASLVILLGTVADFGLPEWPILAILGIDGLMDMARTSVNVAGNCLAATVISRWEGCFKPNYEHPFYEGHRPAGWSPPMPQIGLTPQVET